MRDRAQPPSVEAYCNAVKNHVSDRAKFYSVWFSRAALVIIATHVLATLCATIALASHGNGGASAEGELHHRPLWLYALLAGELGLLLSGFAVHLWVHSAHPSKAWALSRLLAEISRSVRSLGKLHIYPEYLFRLRLPPELRPLLRTLNILHLRWTATFRDEPWEPIRDSYLHNRLTNPHPNMGQIAYYDNARVKERFRLKLANALFLTCSSLAILATTIELLPHGWTPMAPPWAAKLSIAAIVLPVFAVAALSWAAAMDYEARVHTFGEMSRYLVTQCDRLRAAVSAQEFQQLVEETETRLLGETAEWYSRRSFGSV